MHILRSLLVLATTLSSIAPAYTQSNGQPVYRYKLSLESQVPNPPTDDQEYDIYARFVGMAGRPFDSVVPTKPGVSVSSWGIVTGALPAGLEFDTLTARIHGVPLRSQGERELSVEGYDRGSTGSLSRANVGIRVLEPQDGSIAQDFYVRTGTSFEFPIDVPHGIPVASWSMEEQAGPTLTVRGSHLVGSTNAEGSWATVLSGRDRDDMQVALSFGSLISEANPKVPHVADHVLPANAAIGVSAAVRRSLGALVWSTEGDPLPAGLAIDADTGILAGAVATHDTVARIRLVARDVDGASGRSNEFRVGTLPASVPVDQIGDLDMIVDDPFSRRFVAEAGGEAPVWTLHEGLLPPGMSLASDGTLFGIPTEVGTWSGVRLSVQRSDVRTLSEAFEIRVADVAISASIEAVSARVGQPFESGLPTVVGGRGPWSFQLAEGAALPIGIAMDTTSGRISGTPETAGNLTLAIVAVDANGRRSTPFLAGIVVHDLLSVSLDRARYAAVQYMPLGPTVLPRIVDGSLVGEGVWRLAAGALPEGLELDASTGRVHGIPEMFGSFGPFNLTLTDADGSTARTPAFHIDVAEAAELTTSSRDVAMPLGVEHRSGAVAVEGAIGGHTSALDVSSASLPSGLAIDGSGFVVGTATAVGRTTGVVVRVTDGRGRMSVSPPFTVSVVEPRQMEASPIEYVWAADRQFTVPAPQISNVVGSVTFASADLPAGMVVDHATGELSGTLDRPSSTWSASLRVTDEIGRTADIPVRLSTVGNLAAVAPADMSVARLEPGRTLRFDAREAVGEVIYRAVGALPPGLSLNSATGTISGRPTTEGRYDVAVVVTDATGRSAQATTRVEVGPRRALTLTYAISGLVVGTDVGLPIRPAANTDAEGAVAFSATGSLPTGLRLDPDTGIISGTPSQTGSWRNVFITAVDADGASATTVPLSFEVSPQGNLTAAQSSFRVVRVGEVFETATINVANAYGALRFASASGLPLNDPDGFVLNASTGAISGTARTTGRRDYAIRIMDGTSRSTSTTVGLNVLAQLAVAVPDAQPFSGVSFTITPTVTASISTNEFWIDPSTPLPSGVSIDTRTGVVTGRLANVGTYGPFVTNLRSGTLTASDTFTITVRDGPPIVVAEFPDQLVVEHSLQFNQVFQISGGIPGANYSTSLAGPSLPAGLTFARVSGTTNNSISGTSTAVGTYGPYTLRVSDGSSVTQRTFTIVVRPLPELLFSYEDFSAPMGSAMPSTRPTTSGGRGLVTYRHVEGELPPGVEFNMFGMFFTGTPTRTGVYPVRFTASNLGRTAYSNRFEITVTPNGGPIIMVPTELRVVAGQSFTTAAPMVNNYLGAYSFRSPAAQAAGLSVDASTGRISGTIDQVGSYTFDLDVTDTTNRVTARSQSIVIIPERIGASEVRPRQVLVSRTGLERYTTAPVNTFFDNNSATYYTLSYRDGGQPGYWLDFMYDDVVDISSVQYAFVGPSPTAPFRGTLSVRYLDAATNRYVNVSVAVPTGSGTATLPSTIRTKEIRVSGIRGTSMILSEFQPKG